MIRGIGMALCTSACFLVLLGFRLGHQSTQAQLQIGSPATVTLRVMDSYGNSLDYKVESFFAKDQPNVNLAAQFEGLTFKHAVQGKMYEFRLVPVVPSKERPAFRQWVTVGEPITLAVFSVPKAVLLPDTDNPWPVTRLIIKPAPGGESVWVNARPAFGPDISGIDTSETAAVSREGAFNLHGTHGGLYVVTIYKGSKILKLAIVDIPQFAPPEPIEIKN